MGFTYDLSTDIGKVRLLIPDVRQSEHVFEDDEVTAFLTLEDNDVRKAAALALETIASDNVLVLKVIKLVDLQTDGARVAQALRARATALRAKSAELADEAEVPLDWSEMVLTDFQWREQTWYETA